MNRVLNKQPISDQLNLKVFIEHNKTENNKFMLEWELVGH